MREDQRLRREAIVAMYAGGATLQQTGAEFGISRERVRQLAVDAGVQRSTKETHTMMHERLAAVIDIPELCRQWGAGTRIEDLATHFRETPAALRRLIDEHASADDMQARNLAMRRRMSVSQKQAGRRTFSDEEALAAVAMAAELIGDESIGQKRYDALAQEYGWPRAQTVAIRYGDRWNAVVRLAGLKPLDSPSGFGEPKFTDEECFTAVVRVQALVDGVLSCDEYQQRRNPDEPSGHLMRRRFGSWINVLDRIEVSSARSA